MSFNLLFEYIEFYYIILFGNLKEKINKKIFSFGLIKYS